MSGFHHCPDCSRRDELIDCMAAMRGIDRDELARFIGPPASAHLILHSTGDVTAMYPFNRAKLKSDEPATRLADMSDVARAKREAMDYADDRDAVAVRHVDRQVGDLAKRVNDVTNRVAGLEKREPTAVATGPVYFAPVYDNGRFRSVDEANALVVEYARLHAERDELETRVKRQAQTISDVTLECFGLRKENASLLEANRKENDDLRKRCDYLQLCKDQQAKTIGEMQVAAKNRDAFVEALEKTITNLEREREHIREGREKAVAHGLKLAKENDALRLSLTERDLRLTTIRSKAESVVAYPAWSEHGRSVRDLLETCL